MKRFGFSKLATAAAMGCLMSYPAGAAVITFFDFGGSNGTGTYTPSPGTTDPNVVVTPLSSNGVANAIDDPNANASGSYSTRPVTAIRPGNNVTADQLATQVTNNNYVYFDVTAPAGGSISLSSLSFDYARGGSSSTRSVGFKTSLDSTFDFSDLNISATRPTFMNSGAIDLSAARYQNLTGTTRFEFFVATGTSTSSVDADNIILNGVVNTPEPASLSLLGLGGFALLARRRRIGR